MTRRTIRKKFDPEEWPYHAIVLKNYQRDYGDTLGYEKARKEIECDPMDIRFTAKELKNLKAYARGHGEDMRSKNIRRFGNLREKEVYEETNAVT